MQICIIVKSLTIFTKKNRYMKRLILKSNDEPVEIHIINTGNGAIDHAIKMLESNAEFHGIQLSKLENWGEHKVFPALIEHKYIDGSTMELGDKVELTVAKSTKRIGEITFEQSAYGFKATESGMNHFTPFCVFSDSVSFKKLK